MRLFVNPGNAAFEVAINSQIYVDKTGLLSYTNSVVNTKQALICSSKPRCFGKSVTADMLCAYYSRGCNSDHIFTKYEIVLQDYINFLRGMFKGSQSTKFIALAYLTGILPIKKLKTQSALNNFTQFTMIMPGALAKYISFTEDEV